MELDEAISKIVAQVIEEVVGILAGGVRADECLAAIVEECRLDGFLPDRHHRIIRVDVAVLGEGCLVDDDAMVTPPARRDRVLQRPEVDTPASREPQRRRGLCARNEERRERGLEIGMHLGHVLVLRGEPADLLPLQKALRGPTLRERRLAEPPAAPKRHEAMPDQRAIGARLAGMQRLEPDLLNGGRRRARHASFPSQSL